MTRTASVRIDGRQLKKDHFFIKIMEAPTAFDCGRGFLPLCPNPSAACAPKPLRVGTDTKQAYILKKTAHICAYIVFF